MRTGIERAVGALQIAERLATDLRELVLLRERVALAEVNHPNLNSRQIGGAARRLDTRDRAFRHNSH
jgi:hypothetical protein